LPPVKICQALLPIFAGRDEFVGMVAKWLNTFGVAGIICKYRVSPYRHPIPLTDAQRAIRTVRAHGKEWNVDPKRVGILGFSAGGHLASTAATHFKGEPIGTPMLLTGSALISLLSIATFAVLCWRCACRQRGQQCRPDEPRVARLHWRRRARRGRKAHRAAGAWCPGPVRSCAVARGHHRTGSDGLVDEGLYLEPDEVAKLVREHPKASAQELALLLGDAADAQQREPSVWEPDGSGTISRQP